MISVLSLYTGPGRDALPEASHLASFKGPPPAPNSIDIVLTLPDPTRRIDLQVFMNELKLHPVLTLNGGSKLRIFIYTTAAADRQFIAEEVGAESVEVLNPNLHSAAVPVSFLTNHYGDLAQRTLFLNGADLGRERRKIVLERLGVVPEGDLEISGSKGMSEVFCDNNIVTICC
ncbi:hypothetical protein HDU67_008011 [Dinochytrium kinnereticum]|nr:hypothetical protein HDU67_008011 [Dinochytrium kinnereticum]